MRTDKVTGTEQATQGATVYRSVTPTTEKPTPSTTIATESVRTVTTRRTEGQVAVRIGLAESKSRTPSTTR